MPVHLRIWESSYDVEDEQAVQDGIVLFYDPRLERGEANLGRRFRQEDPSIRNADLIVFRGGGRAFFRSVEEDPALKHLVGEIPVLALVAGVDAQDPGPKLWKPGWSREPTIFPSIENLRSIEVKGLLDRTDAILRPDDYHFSYPSGDHGDVFVQLRHAFHDRIDVARLADWILGYVRNNAVILGDNGSLLTLLSFVRQQAHEYFGWSVHVDALEEYPSETEILASRIEEVQLHSDGKDRLLFLLSVNSSGRLAKRASSAGPPSMALLSICDVSDGPEKSTSLLRLSAQSWVVGQNGKCEECDRSPSVFVHPRTYEVRPELKWTAQRLDWRKVEARRDLWEAFHRTSALKLCVSVTHQESRTRHHGIYVEMDKLAADPWFSNQCLKALDKLLNPNRPELVLVPEHASSDVPVALAEAVGFNREAIRLVPSGAFSNELVDEIARVDSVLVMDDALVTADTLKRLRTQIHWAGQRYHRNPIAKAFVLLARPSDRGTIETVRRKYTSEGGPQFAYGELVFMPSGDQCPWCIERKLLEVWAPKLGPAGAIAGKRIDQLRGHVPRNLFLAGDRDDQALLTEGAFVGTLDQVTGFTAFACIAQQERQSLGEYQGGNEFKIVDLKHALDCYFEDVFVAGIFRTLQPIELRYRGQDAIVEAWLRDTEGPVSLNLLTELAWAACLGKIPHSAVLDLLDRSTDHDEEVLSFLKSIIQLNVEIAGYPVD